MHLTGGQRLGLISIYDGANNGKLVSVDIVAVHGIGADPKRTWTCNGTNWLSDVHMLPSKAQDTRILQFGYESDWLGKNAIKTRIHNIAEQLLQSLASMRRQNKTRPILFIGHCFGGLVVEQAIVHAQTHLHDYSDISISTRAVITLGTPHRGSSSQPIAAMLAKAAAFLKVGEESALLSLVSKDSDVLRDLVSDYTRLALHNRLHLFCFFEQHKSEVAKPVRGWLGSWWSSTWQEYIVDEDSACIQGIPSLGLPCDHFQLNRYPNEGDPSYRAVEGIVLKFIDQIKEEQNQQTVEQRLADDLRRKSFANCDAMNSIFLSDPRHDFEAIMSEKGRCLQGSAAWLFQSPEYQEWQSSNKDVILWISGGPGKGKTTLMTEIIESRKDAIHGGGNGSIFYFFCDRGDDRRNTSVALLRGLLWAVYQQHPKAIPFLQAEYDKRGNSILSTSSTTQILWKLLLQALRETEDHEVTILIDGLDECDNNSSEELLLHILSSMNSDTHKDQIQNTSLKWIVASRREDPMLEQLENALQINLEENVQEVNKAIEMYIQSETNKLSSKKHLNEDLTRTVYQTMCEKAEGTFIWVSLAFRQLSKPKVRAMHVRQLLSEMPKGIMQLYQTIFDQITTIDETLGEDNVKFVTTVLRAVYWAFRPLNFEEFAVVADLQHIYDLDTMNLEDIERSCGSFIERRNDKIHFVHSSARNFLSKTDLINSQVAQEEHAWIARNCAVHLAQWAKTHELYQNQRITEQSKSRVTAYPALFWNGHARSAGGTLHPQHFPEFFEPDSTVRDAWFLYHWRQTHTSYEPEPSRMSFVLVLTYAMLPNLLQESLGNLDLEPLRLQQDSLGNTALLLSAKSGDIETSQILINNGFDCKQSNNRGETPLHWAATMAQTTLVELLLHSGARINQQEQAGWTPLHMAAHLGHKNTVEILLHHGADVDCRDQASWTALQRCASNGQVTVMKALVDADATIEIKDREGMTPLATASWNGHVDAVKLLLEEGALIEAPDYEGWRPLHHACWNGMLQAAKFLIEAGAKVNAQNHEGFTPLLSATWNGHTRIVRMLLDEGANANDICASGETVLHQAAWAGHIDIIQVLVERGANINVVDDSGATALHQASCNGQSDAVELLLQLGADQDLENTDGQTALDQAKENSYETTAELLKHKGTPTLSSTTSSRQASLEIVRLDPALCKLLCTDSDMCQVQRHGHACSSESWRVTVLGPNRRSYFLKTGENAEMFHGEYVSLNTLKAVVPTLCPNGIAHGTFERSNKSFLLTEFIHVGTSRSRLKPKISLAVKLGKLHKHPAPIPENGGEPLFGFSMTTFAGPVQQRNAWCKSWADFYANNRLRGVCEVIATKYAGQDSLLAEVERVATHVVPRLLAPGHLGGADGIKPALVHGDLWSGNKTCGVISGTTSVEHYVFDASSCYAHSEYELGLMRMFGGFSAGFFSEYHRIVPKTHPVDEYEDRMLLYQLYHWLVNYAISGGGFKDEALSCMKLLCDKYHLP